MIKPLVSVSIITYNHGAYLKECLQSVVDQVTDFPFEIIVGEDCSTDDTRQILKEFEIAYPKLIKPIYHVSNVGMMRNGFQYCLAKCQGKYIASLEGDDFWIDPYKLQKQVDFMEANPSVVFSFHGSKTFNQVTGEWGTYYKPWQFGDREIIKNQQKLIKTGGGFSATASTMFKTEVVENIPDYWFESPVGDMLVILRAIELGEIGYLADEMSVYREMSSSSWSQQMVDFDKRIHMHDSILETLHKFRSASSDEVKAKMSLTMQHFEYLRLHFILNKLSEEGLFTRINRVISKRRSLGYSNSLKAMLYALRLVKAS